MILRLILFLLAAVGTFAVPRPDTQEQLQRLVRLPRIQYSSPLQFHPLCGFVPFSDSAAARNEISELRKEARNNSRPGQIYLEIARLQQSAGNRGEALTGYLTARQALRKELDLDPENAATLCALAEALTATESFAEAEHHLRKASKIKSDLPALAVAWGRLHAYRAWKKIVPDEDVLGTLSFEATLYESLENPPAPEDISEIIRDLNSAEKWFTRALESEGEKSPLHREMAGFRHLQSAMLAVLHTLGGNDHDNREFRGSLFPPETLRHLQEAMEAPDAEPSTAVIAALAVVYRSHHQQQLDPEHFFDGALWVSLNESQRSLVKSALRVLEKIADSNEKRAATARDYLGCLEFVIIGDARAAEQNLRQAIAAGTKSERAWDYLALALGQNHRSRELVLLQEERVQRRSSTRNRILLAKAYDRSGQLEMAQLHALLALQINANDFLSNLALANLLMKSPNVRQYLPRIQECITKAEKNLGTNPTFENMFDLALTKTIYYGLTEDLERARKILQEWLQVSRDNKDLQAALEVIGY